MKNNIIQYIDKSEVVAEIERRVNEYPCDNSEQNIGYHCALYEMQDFLNNLEVKEVDLEKEIKSSMNNLCELDCYVQSLLDNPEDYEGFAKPFPKEVDDEIANFAKHFFELGLKLKAQKGE